MQPTDPICFECHGTVEVIERDDTLITVYCPTCDHWFGVEVEQRPDGTAVYWPLYRVALSGNKR